MNFLCTILACIFLVSTFFIASLVKAIFRADLEHADRITSLPGLQPAHLQSRHYSGYLDAINGARLFYWFIESKSNPKVDPVLLFLTGGPGCSSLLGALGEIGPLRMQPNGSLVLNPFSWNTKANLLFLESPVGTGFSYIPNFTETYFADDISTAETNLEALRSFYRKFPHLAVNSFYIAGESYAARFVVQLATLIVSSHIPARLHGIAIGNGKFLRYTDQMRARRRFLHLHGISGVSTVAVPNSRRVWLHNIHRQCRDDYFTNYYEYFIGYERFHNVTRNTPEHLLPQCGSEVALLRWLNRGDVKRGIHAEPDWPGRRWDVCDRRGVLMYRREESSLAPLVRDLAQSGIRVLLYYGDADYLETFVGGQWFINTELQFRLLSKDEPLYFAGSPVATVYRYEHQLTFVQIFNAGHMAPVDAPGPVLQMLQKFVLKEIKNK